MVALLSLTLNTLSDVCTPKEDSSEIWTQLSLDPVVVWVTPGLLFLRSSSRDQHRLQHTSLEAFQSIHPVASLANDLNSGRTTHGFLHSSHDHCCAEAKKNSSLEFHGRYCTKFIVQCASLLWLCPIFHCDQYLGTLMFFFYFFLQ